MHRMELHWTGFGVIEDWLVARKDVDQHVHI